MGKRPGAVCFARARGTRLRIHLAHAAVTGETGGEYTGREEGILGKTLSYTSREDNIMRRICGRII